MSSRLRCRSKRTSCDMSEGVWRRRSRKSILRWVDRRFRNNGHQNSMPLPGVVRVWSGTDQLTNALVHHIPCMQVFGYVCSGGCRFKAEQQKIQVPVCEFQKSVSEAKQWRKVGAIAALMALCLAGLFGFYAWYLFVGSHPKLYYTWKAPKGEAL